MATFTRPDIYIDEAPSNAVAITGVSTSVTGFLGIAQRGPVNRPVRCLAFSDFTRVFGGAVQNEGLYYAVKGFFENGGGDCYIVRVATLDANLDNFVASSAQKALQTIGVASRASAVGNTDVTTIDLADYLRANGTASLVTNANDAGNVTSQIIANGAELNGAPFALGNGTLVGGETMTVSVNGGAVQTLTFAVGDDADEATVLAKLNTLIGVSAVSDGAKFVIASDRIGSSASVSINFADANVTASLGFATGDTIASVGSNVLRADVITFAELSALFLDPNIRLETNGNNNVVLTATNGNLDLANKIVIDASSTNELVTALGLVEQQYDAVGGVAQDAFEIRAGFRGNESPGTFGNGLAIRLTEASLYASQGAGNDILADVLVGGEKIQVASLVGISAGSHLKIDDNGTVQYALVQSTETTVLNGVVSHFATLAEPLATLVTSATAVLSTVEYNLYVYSDGDLVETWLNLSVNPSSDGYLATVLNDDVSGSSLITAVDNGLSFPNNLLDSLNETFLAGGTNEVNGLSTAHLIGDEANRTGLYALDAVHELNLVCVPASHGTSSLIPADSSVAKSSLQNAILAYCKSRFDCFAILDCPKNDTPAQALAYRNNVLGADNAFGALYYPYVKVSDVLGYGSNPTVAVSPVGHLAGIYARVDNLPSPTGGVSTAPAGLGEFGKVRGVVALASDVGDRDQDALNPAGVNCIRRFTRGGPSAPGIIVFGARTLSSSDKDMRYIQVRRMTTFVEQSIVQGSRFALFRNNDPRLWAKLTDAITRFLREQHRLGRLYGSSASEAYFVKIDDTTTTADDIANGVLRGEVGIATQRPAEFIVFRFSQLQTGTSIEE